MKRDVTIKVKVDQDELNELNEVFQDIGLTTETAIQLFLKQSLIYQGFPFKLRRNKNKINSRQKRYDDLKKDRVEYAEGTFEETNPESSMINDYFD